MANGERILVVDDEPQILRALKSLLARRGYGVTLAASGEEALQRAAETQPSLVILDLTLPGISGLEVCRRIREWSKMPILILSVRGEEADKISALDLGADDYLTKPFQTGELLARVRALLRRSSESSEQPTVIRSGPVTIDLAEKRVMVEERAVRLTRTEFAVLAVLAERADRVVTTRELLSSVWGSRSTDETPTLRVHVSNLRSKIESDPGAPTLIVTEPGVGYRLITHPVSE